MWRGENNNKMQAGTDRHKRRDRRGKQLATMKNAKTESQPSRK